VNIIDIETHFLWLVGYSLLGWLYESALCSIREKRILNRGFLNGPYCPIYGCGALLNVLALGQVENPFLLFFFGAGLACGIEYLISYGMEKLFHARWWDYSGMRLNLNGRICLCGAVIFGTFTVLLIKIAVPLSAACTAAVPQLIRHILAVIIFLVFFGDIAVTVNSFIGFNRELSEFSALLEQKKAEIMAALEGYKDSAVKIAYEKLIMIEASAAYEKFIQSLSKQQRRMITAFPKLKLIQYNDILHKIRWLLYKEEDSKKQTSQSSFQYQSCMEKGPESACSMDNP